MEIKRVGIYCRVSSKDQNPETQVLELRRYCGLRNWEIVSEQTDKAWSRSTDSRPGLDQAMQMARQRNFDALLTWKLDRYATSLPNLVTSLAELKSVGCYFVSYKDGINTADDTPYTRFFIKIMHSMSELEREMINERTNAGRQRVFEVFRETGKIDTKSGRWFGHPRVHGEAADEIIRSFADRFRDGQVSLREIAAAAGVSRPTACRRLKAFHKSPANVEFSFDGAGVEKSPFHKG